MSPSPSTSRRLNLTAGVGLVAIAAAIAVFGGVIDPGSWRTPSRSPSFFPALILAGLVICGVLIAARASAPTAFETDSRTWRTIAMGLVVAAYAVALPIAGFVLSTAALSLGIAIALGYRRWVVLTGFAAAVIGFCWFIFISLMRVPLNPFP